MPASLHPSEVKSIARGLDCSPSGNYGKSTTSPVAMETVSHAGKVKTKAKGPSVAKGASVGTTKPFKKPGMSKHTT